MRTRKLRPDGTIDPRSVAPTWGPPKGYLRQVAECMRERGWNSTYDEEEDTMLTDGVPKSERERMLADSRECERAAGMPAGDPPPFTDDQLTVLYQHELRTVECLRRQGYEILDPPPQRVFEDGVRAESYRRAYSALPHMPEAEWKRINRECPQEPDGW